MAVSRPQLLVSLVRLTSGEQGVRSLTAAASKKSLPACLVQMLMVYLYRLAVVLTWVLALPLPPLLAAMLRKGEATGAGTPASQYECVVPELGRVWIGQDREASAALAEVLSDRCGQDNPILAILTEALSGRSSAAAPVDTAQGHQHTSDIDPKAVSGSEPEPALSASVALATHPSRAPLSAAQPPELFGWLRDGLAEGSIEINTRAALVHHVPEGLLLVSPGIFRSFLAWQGADANSQEALKRLQRSVLKAGWHLVGADGANVLGYAWTKNGKATARLHGIVIEQPQRLLDPLPPINPRLARIAGAGGSDP